MNNFKNVCLFAVGVAVGSISTYFICKDILEKEFEDILNEELELAKGCDEKTPTASDKPDLRVNVETIYERSEEMEEMENFEGEDKTPYSSYSGNKEVNVMPYVISEQVYYEENTINDKITLSYYTDDDTLVDEDDSVIQDIDYHIGEESLNHFGDMSGDPSIVYVRNEKLASDYEVVKVEASYSAEVLGLDVENGGE